MEGNYPKGSSGQLNNFHTERLANIPMLLTNHQLRQISDNETLQEGLFSII